MSNERPETGAFFQRDRQWQPPAYTPGYKTSVVRSPQKALISLDNTLSEITGPVFGHSMLGALDADLIHNFAKAGESAIGPRIIVHGRVLDERGKGVAGALVEVWQANAGGRYRHKKESYLAPLDPNFGGCGRVITDADGSYFGLRPRVRPAADHADVFRGRSADLALPDRGHHSRPRGGGGAGGGARHAGHDPDGCARLQVRHRPARPSLDAV